MASSRKPIRLGKAEGEAPATLMGNQRDGGREVTATRTARMTVSTTPELLEAVTAAAHDARCSRSEFTERALRAYLGTAFTR